MTPEGKVKAKVKKILTDKNIWFCMPVPAGFSRRGIPDIICCVNGRFLSIETKAGKGKTTALQEHEMSKIRDSKGHTLIISEDNISEVINTINMLEILC